MTTRQRTLDAVACYTESSKLLGKALATERELARLPRWRWLRARLLRRRAAAWVVDAAKHLQAGDVSRPPETDKLVVVSFGDTIYGRCKGILAAFGFREPKVAESDGRKDVTLAILGIHRDASSFVTELAKTHPHLLAKTTVVDFNIAIHDRIRGMGVKVKYGDISNEESLIHAGVNRAKIIVCTISDDLLRGITNRDLVRLLRHINPEATIISNAIQMQGWRDLKEAGADIVYMSRFEVAKSLVRAVVLADEDRADEFVDEQYATVSEPRLRHEIMD